MSGLEISYVGPFRDYSGYGEANRNDIAALDAAGVEVFPIEVSYTRDAIDLGTEMTKLLERLTSQFISPRGGPKITVMHTTPDQFRKHRNPAGYNIGRFFWETTRVPKAFVDGLNLCDEIWTGSAQNVTAMVSSGVTAKITVIPQAAPEWGDILGTEPYELAGRPGFLFYSIFEWIERKNPRALLKAYWEEFGADEDVGLLIKTYFRDFQPQHKQMIRDDIRRWKKETGLAEFPKVYLVQQLLSRRQMLRLHLLGDCFVSAHRGEGWGIPQVEAMTVMNPVISTGFGGVHESLDEETAYLVPFELTKVFGMEHSPDWYQQDQEWAEVDHAALKRAMRAAFSAAGTDSPIGANGQILMRKKFSHAAVGALMRDRLLAISKTI